MICREYGGHSLDTAHMSKTPKVPKRDAYTAFPPSPDSEWSTLAPSKRQHLASAKKSPARISGKFTLPVRFLGSQAGHETKHPSCALSVRRITTYLPPPPQVLNDEMSACQELQYQDPGKISVSGARSRSLFVALR